MYLKALRIIVLIAIVIAVIVLASHLTNYAEWLVLGSFLVAGYAAWKLQI